jgi:5'-nucleotidase
MFMIVLIDMDGVIADFEQGVIDGLRRFYSEVPIIPKRERKIFHVDEQYPREYQPLVRSVYQLPGFYRNLKPIVGSLEALADLEKNHDIRICTSPLTVYHNCVLEKYEWVENNLGESWVKRIMLMKDKTLANGDILIDDKPNITGSISPSWEHILYSAPYNQEIKNRRRLNWHNYNNVIKI